MQIGNSSRITIADVAKKAGVSTATVSRVINNSGTVSQSTRALILDSIEELNYHPQSAAQILASKRTKTIGLIFPVFIGDYFAPLLRGIEAAAQEHGFQLLIYSTQGSKKRGGTIRSPLGEQNTDGVLVFVDSISDRELIRFHNIHFPVVLIHQTPPKGIEIPCVTIENIKGAMKIVDHLIEIHGYRKIAYLSGDDDQEDSHWRENGYRKSLENHGIRFDPNLVASGGFEREQARKTVEAWLDNDIEIEAIFSGNDEMAIGAMTAFSQKGIKIPEDMALVGFDDISLSKYLHPPLTTVHAPTEQVGKESIHLLIDQIEGKEKENLVLLPTNLVIRSSCGCN